MKEQKPTVKQSDKLSVVLGAAFLMATAAVGPSFLTQSATFTQELGGTFGFVILVALLMSVIVQITIWRVICVSGLRGQEIADKVLPGLGYVLIVLIAGGCLIFNIGNIAGCAMGLEVIFGLDLKVGTIIAIVLTVLLFLSKEAGRWMDKLTQILGIGMILLIAYVAVVSKSPVDEAVVGTIRPSHIPFMAILTIVGGTVGGYHPFAGGHRLLEGRISGYENLRKIDQSASIGIAVANIIRILLFVAILGAVSQGAIWELIIRQRMLSAMWPETLAICFSELSFCSPRYPPWSAQHIPPSPFLPVSRKKSSVAAIFSASYSS